MSESKQEAQLPERIEKAIATLAKVADDGILFRSVHGFNYKGGNLVEPLRSAILAALDEVRLPPPMCGRHDPQVFKAMEAKHCPGCAIVDEARDEALVEAANLVEHPQTSFRRIELADKIRALKSKR